MSCSVKGCFNRKRSRPDGVSFHCFPKEPLLSTWKSILQLDDDWQVTPNKFVCSEHFSKDDYMMMNKIKLKPRAIPRIKNEAPIAENCEVFISNTTDLTDSVEDTLPEEIVAGPVPNCSSTSLKPTLKKTVSFKTSRKRKQSETLSESDTSTSDSFSIQPEKSKQRINFMHSYCTSITDIKSKYATLQDLYIEMKRKLYTVNCITRQLQQQLSNLRIVLIRLKEKNSISEDAAFHLEAFLK